MEWLKNRAVKLVGELKARDWRELQENYFQKFIVMWKEKGAGFLLEQ